ncbi:FAD-binding domain protein [Rhizoctonia solani AG-3 Rhs1AP]|uniref:FAD-binding domain protein n=1 Tax=Rhizoctonia solani AG-3 Rhs1AP TaxID=1086054 RepID=X8IZ29_9AGAM|nr:FAD-binding domain protein [Rhizoctonia solani AG-3 Rhs1AP]
MQNSVWDSPDCRPDTPRSMACDQAFVPIYSVDARIDDDVTKAVKFADKYHLRLVVKNTGHDFFGRSSGKGSFSIWTHNLKGIHFTDSFVAAGCSATLAEPAVTIGAAEQWADVYRAANDHNVTVVGGAFPTVGAAGGWLQGGGHSPLSGLYGLGVDNVLQFRVVKPDGLIVTANKCQNQDLFWALRGGGGNTWGVVLDVTYKTHPQTPVIAISMSIDPGSIDKLTKLSELLFLSLPNITDQGLRGYGSWESPHSFSMLWVHPNSSSIQSTNNTLHAIYDWVNANHGTQLQLKASAHSTYYDMFTNYTPEPEARTSFWIGARLVSRDAFATNSQKLAQYITGKGRTFWASFNLIGRGAISKMDPESTGLNPQWRKDALMSWEFSGSWALNMSSEEIEVLKANTTQVVQDFGKIAGLDDAAYMNEADPLEPQWKKAFWGSHYERLAEIKRQIDPKGLFTCNRCVGSDLE